MFRLRVWAKARARAAQERVERWTRHGLEQLRPLVLEEVTRRVHDTLDARRLPLESAWQDANWVIATIRVCEGNVARIRARLDTTPLSAAMSVHAAHARSPEVQAVFARFGLPRCTDCAVGADETLAEAALGEGFSLEELLNQLRPHLTEN